MATSTTTDRAGGPLRIFLVENHQDTREMTQIYLEMLGHTVASAETMADALAALSQGGGYDVLISDIGLPDGDGWELMRQLKLPRPIYANAMSGFGLGEDQRNSKEAGYRHHLLKPVDLKLFDAALVEAATERSSTV